MRQTRVKVELERPMSVSDVGHTTRVYAEAFACATGYERGTWNEEEVSRVRGRGALKC